MAVLNRRIVLRNIVLSGLGVACGSPGSGLFSAAAASDCPSKTKREFMANIPHILSFSAGESRGDTHVDRSGVALVDRNGNLLRPLDIFSEIGRFFEAPGGDVIARAKNRHDGKWGYISGKGEWLTAPQFDEARDFGKDGLARCYANEKWGYVDLTGALRIPVQFKQAFPFSHGVAVVQVGDTWGYIDATGKVVIEPVFGFARAFSAQGFAPVRVDLAKSVGKTGPQWGYIDRTGKIVIAPKFTGAEPFGPGGLAPAKEGEKWGLIDVEGKWVVTPQYSQLEEYNADGFAYFVKTDRARGYLSADGKEAIMGDSHLYDVMQCGMVRDSYYNMGFYNTDGAMAIPKQFDWAGNFSADTGLAIGRLKGVWGILSANGQFTPYEHKEPQLHGDWWMHGIGQSGLCGWTTAEGVVEWLDLDGQLRFRVAQTGTSIALTDAHNKTIWQSDPAQVLKLHEGPKFEAGPKQFFADIAHWEGDIVEVARKLLREPARKFVPYSLVYDEERDPYDLSGVDEDELPEVVRNGALIVLATTHVNETGWGRYYFLSNQRSDAYKQIYETLQTRLTAAFGEPAKAPSHLHSRDVNKTAYWRTSDGAALQLEWVSQSGDGDFEHHILLAALR